MNRRRTSVGAVLELTQGFRRSGEACEAVAPASDPQYAVYALGVEAKLATGAFGTGRLAKSMTGATGEVCLVPVVFEETPQGDLYVLTTSYGYDTNFG